MCRPATVWWNKQRGAWCTDIGGARHVLAKGKANKKFAKDRLRALLDERALLADVNGAITVAAVCDAFLDDALHNLAMQTYKSYQYGCQKFVHAYAGRAAHTMRPLDIARFARDLNISLNPASQAIVKFGNVRDANGHFIGVRGDPQYVKECCDASLRRLRVDMIDLYYQPSGCVGCQSFFSRHGGSSTGCCS